MENIKPRTLGENEKLQSVEPANNCVKSEPFEFLNGKKVQIDDSLNGYELCHKASTNVEFFGIGPDDETFFIQFKSGSYFFQKVPMNVMQGAKYCDSIGKYFFANIKGKYESYKHDRRLVTELPQVEAQEVATT
jgi:hypothetical protein